MSPVTLISVDKAVRHRQPRRVIRLEIIYVYATPEVKPICTLGYAKTELSKLAQNNSSVCF
jgi:hypothetical protein